MALKTRRNNLYQLQQMADSVHQNLQILINNLKPHDLKDAESTFSWAEIMINEAKKLLK